MAVRHRLEPILDSLFRNVSGSESPVKPILDALAARQRRMRSTAWAVWASQMLQLPRRPQLNFYAARTGEVPSPHRYHSTSIQCSGQAFDFEDIISWRPLPPAVKQRRMAALSRLLLIVHETGSVTGSRLRGRIPISSCPQALLESRGCCCHQLSHMPFRSENCAGWKSIASLILLTTVLFGFVLTEQTPRPRSERRTTVHIVVPFRFRERTEHPWISLNRRAMSWGGLCSHRQQRRHGGLGFMNLSDLDLLSETLAVADQDFTQWSLQQRECKRDHDRAQW
ncbi:hypothetical protein Micbo1qcDRAFT_173157 [Microdochium bolleyi]|uniref:Uncharacterized protein n=1 Tax=Microdochium bolleyi TaxID=196109 RepID=A0A136JB25_9PEZI|nr:hypothetical protein Micbo1qcDRAFT_173157 [Microdochium bolleyi]